MIVDILASVVILLCVTIVIIIRWIHQLFKLHLKLHNRLSKIETEQPQLKHVLDDVVECVDDLIQVGNDS